MAALTADVPPLTPSAVPTAPGTSLETTKAASPADTPLDLRLLFFVLSGLLVLVALAVGAVVIVRRRRS